MSKEAQQGEVPEKILEKIRKLIRLKESATTIGTTGEANAAAEAISRLLTEYNLSLLDVEPGASAEKLRVGESGKLNFSDTYGNVWKRDLLRVIAAHNYCRMMKYSGSSNMVLIGTPDNTEVAVSLFKYLRRAFRQLGEAEHAEFVKGKRGYYRTEKHRKNYMRSYLLGCCVGLNAQYESIQKSSKETGLVLCHRQMIDDYVATLRTCTPRQQKAPKKKMNSDAYMSGYKTGYKTNVNRLINNP